VEIKLHILISALSGGECLYSGSGCFTTVETETGEMCGPQSWSKLYTGS